MERKGKGKGKEKEKSTVLRFDCHDMNIYIYTRKIKVDHINSVL